MALPCSCSNRAAAYLALGMWDEALKDAERARMLAQDALKRTHTAVPLYIKTFAQKGEALIGEAWAVLQSRTDGALTQITQIQGTGAAHPPCAMRHQSLLP